MTAAPPPGPSGPPGPPAARRADWRFLLAHPAHFVALGQGSGLVPRAPGTAGTLWAWLVFVALQGVLGPAGWAGVIAASAPLGWWACTRTAQHLGVADPGAVVWDEVLAFWIVLWLLMPASAWWQLAAFVLFRYFDAAKPGPVGWADRRFKLRPGQAIGWAQGAGILLDDLVAAACTLLALWALWALWALLALGGLVPPVGGLG